MNAHKDLIDALGGPHRLAEKLSDAGWPIKSVTARAWSMRESIPAKFWQPCLQLVEQDGKASITLEDLARDAAMAPAEEAAA